MSPVFLLLHFSASRSGDSMRWARFAGEPLGQDRVTSAWAAPFTSSHQVAAAVLATGQI